jgi:hypothetical protein
MVVISHPYRERNIRGDPSKGREMEVSSIQSAPADTLGSRIQRHPGSTRLN